MKVKSAVDIWLATIIWGTFIFVAVSLLMVPSSEQWIDYLIGIPVLIFLGWIYFGTSYELREDELYCKSGPLFERIKYDQITSVKLSRNPLSSMALSINRIEIKYLGKSIMCGLTYISPIEREQFLEELIKRCPNLR